MLPTQEDRHSTLVRILASQTLREVPRAKNIIGEQRQIYNHA